MRSMPPVLQASCHTGHGFRSRLVPAVTHLRSRPILRLSTRLNHGEGEGTFKSAHDAHHAHDAHEGHEGHGCCSHKADDTWLSKTITSVLSSVGIMGIVKRLDHNPTAVGVSTAALIVSGVVRFAFGGGGPGQISAVPSICLAVVCALSGIPMLVDLVIRVAKGSIDTHVLMALAVIGSVLLGLPHEGALLLILCRLSHTLEDKFTREADASLKSLFESIPDKAVLVHMMPNGEPDLSRTTPTGVEKVPVGSYILVLPGEQAPLDGEVVYGQASVTVDHISGESLPVQIRERSVIAAGSRNNDGVLVIKATHTVQNSTPYRIAQLTKDARAFKPKVQRWIDDITSRWSQGVLLATIAVVVVCVLRGIPVAGERGAVYRAMGVVTAAAPCGLVLTPLAYVCALANITKRRILVRGAAVLDLLYGCQSIGLDKTGTLTKGCLTCTAIFSSGSSSASRNGSLETTSECRKSLAYAVALSHRSSHPVALAVKQVGEQLGVMSDVQIEEFELVPGAGVKGVVTGPNGVKKALSFGSVDFVKEAMPKPKYDQLEKNLSTLHRGKSISVLLEKCGGALEWTVFCFEDQIRASSAGAVAALQTGAWKTGSPRANLGKRVVMLTGDLLSSALDTASALGISEVHAELKPEYKLQHILQNVEGPGEHNRFMMVGDGLNDAPALSAADVGVAVASTASGASASIADIVILNGQGVGNLPFLFQLAHKTRQIVTQNLFLTFTSMIVATIPTVAGFFPLWLAVTLHEGTSLFTALNSLRLLVVEPNSFNPRPVEPTLQTLKSDPTPQEQEDQLALVMD